MNDILWEWFGKLRACPFCGGQPKLSPPVNDGPDDPFDFLNQWEVICNNCSQLGKTKGEAIEHWNKRKRSDSLEKLKC